MSVSRRIGDEDPSGKVETVQCPGSVEGSRQQREIRLGELLSPPEQAHGDEEIPIGSERTPEFRSAGWRTIEYGTVAMMAREKTRTAKPAVRATCSVCDP
jgi:hypothetical protein